MAVEQIKRHINKNDYYYVGDNLWVRNLTKKSVQALDLNNLIHKEDVEMILANETANHFKMLQAVDTEAINHNKIIIVSDGYGFEQSQKLLKNLPGDVTIIGVNETISHWNIERKMDYYVVNNPYKECMNFIPDRMKIFPRLIASTRTYPEFIDKFGNMSYLYSPTTDYFYSGYKVESDYFVDDYRNPICAAIGLSYKFEVKKLLLFCCDNAFGENRPGAEKLPNELWMYPQQKIAHNLIDGNLYWLKNSKIKLGYYSKGLEYKHAEYIKEEDLVKFFI